MSNIEPPPTPFILRIPNEILYHILSFLPNLSRNESFVRYYTNGKDYEVSQTLVLRSVCRHFRAVTAELDFWYDADFLFSSLINCFYTGLEIRNDLEGRFLRILFTDAGLVNSLGRRKTDWMFEGLEGLMAVMEGVPLFTQNARVIHLEMETEEMSCFPLSLHTAIDILAACSHITTLSIRLADSVDFNAIAASFPSLETLSCSESSNFYGSLQQLDRLQTLVIQTWGDDSPHAPPWLPLRSAETLTKLSLKCGRVDIPSLDTNSLNAFINLKSLNIGPLCDSVCDFIIRAPIQLDVFETELLRRDAPVDKFIDMLRAECLRNLKEFGLSNYHDDTSDHRAIEQYWSLVFDAFTSMLPSVEEVHLGVPLLLQCCPYFPRMANLKLLNWNGSLHPCFGCGRTSNPKEKIRKALDTAFANFMEKPQFAVRG